MAEDGPKGGPLRAVVGLGLIAALIVGVLVRDAAIAARGSDPGLCRVRPDELRADHDRAVGRASLHVRAAGVRSL